MNDDEITLSGTEVARRLGVHPSTVWRYTADELPYEETRGGTKRRGRRRYRLSDVERFQAGDNAPAPSLTDLTARVADLEAWRRDHEQRHNSGGDPT